MIDRLRALLDRPLDPSAARAILIFASGIFLGLATLFILAGSEPGPTAPLRDWPPSLDSSPVVPVEEREGDAGRRQPPSLRRQDPQDIAGSAAAERAARALRSHRALQHVPYRSGDVTIVLAGARGSRALLRVTAPTLPAGRDGWRRFLRRYRDSGRSYVAVFTERGGRNG
jgi:hypothetical protein